MDAGVEGADRAELFGPPHAPRGIGGHQFVDHDVGLHGARAGQGPGVAAQPVGGEGSGQQVIDGDPVARDLSRQAGDKPRQPGPGANIAL